MNKVQEYNKATEIAERLGITPAEALNEFEELYADWMRDEREFDEEF